MEAAQALDPRPNIIADEDWKNVPVTAGMILFALELNKEGTDSFASAIERLARGKVAS